MKLVSFVTRIQMKLARYKYFYVYIYPACFRKTDLKIAFPRKYPIENNATLIDVQILLKNIRFNDLTWTYLNTLQRESMLDLSFR